MNVFSHGGDLKSLAEEACRPERDILDFSVNLRPEGMPEFIVSALLIVIFLLFNPHTFNIPLKPMLGLELSRLRP